MNPKIKLISVQQSQPPKQGGIKINVSDFPIDQTKQNIFMQQMEHDQNEINNNESPYNLGPYITPNGEVNYQYWSFSFQCTQGCFLGKKIGGILKFPPDFPVTAPKFFFDKLPNGEVIQHVNIYGDNLLCIPLLSHWNPQTSTMEILQAIEHIFTNPNWGDGDAPANPGFNQMKPEQRDQIQLAQAQLLPEFVKE